MCYVGDPFEKDLFVSYAWADPKGAGNSPLMHWSRRLVDELLEDIRTITSEFDRLEHWIDARDLDPTLPPTPALKAGVQGSALLLVVMSPRYLESGWCLKEIGWFEAEVARRGREQGCVLVVRALPSEEGKWPRCLKDEDGHTVIGFCFHPRPGTLETRPHGWPDPQPTDRAFYEALSSLSSRVIQRLRELKSREALKARAAPANQNIEGKPRLYLHARVEQADKWKITKERLEKAGFEVEPAELTAVGSSLLDVRRAQRDRLAKLATCHGLLVLRADSAEDITADIEACQADRADVEAGGRRLPCAVLDTAGGAIPASSAAVIEAFAIDVLPATGPDWLLPKMVRGWRDRAQAALTEAAE